jgi:2-keto-4-pentenoate hydratase/2-oxohepta-3-ene-1,7-dioic acid hydratase in catechol pathway
VRLVSFSVPDGAPRPGLVVGDEVVDLGDAATGLPPTMRELLALGHEAGDRIRAAGRTRAPRHALSSVRRHAPVPDPPAILAIGMNYRAHVAELGREPPEWQYWFNKQRTAVAGPGDPILLPVVSDMVDYEGELAMVIGPRCQHVPAARALEVVAGFTVINDVSARDWQWRTPTFTMGKSFDSHAPCGPELVTGDELGDPGHLAIRTWVNDELRQDSTTADLIFGCAAMIEYLTMRSRSSRAPSSPPGPRRASVPASTRRATWPPATSCASPSRGWASWSTRSSRTGRLSLSASARYGK